MIGFSSITLASYCAGGESATLLSRFRGGASLKWRSASHGVLADGCVTFVAYPESLTDDTIPASCAHVKWNSGGGGAIPAPSPLPGIVLRRFRWRGCSGGAFGGGWTAWDPWFLSSPAAEIVLHSLRRRCGRVSPCGFEATQPVAVVSLP